MNCFENKINLKSNRNGKCFAFFAIKGWLMLVVFLIGCSDLFSQTIDRSLYEETTLFDLEIWTNTATQKETRKFKAAVLFADQRGPSLGFYDLDKKTFDKFNINKRWPEMTAGQKVVIYFEASTSTFVRSIVDIDFGSAVLSKPWQPYIDDGNSDKTGWYLRPIGNGRYEEIYYE